MILNISNVDLFDKLMAKSRELNISPQALIITILEQELGID